MAKFGTNRKLICDFLLVINTNLASILHRFPDIAFDSPRPIKLIEGVQRRATKLVTGMQDLQYNERLKQLGLMRLERRRVRGDLIETFKIMNGVYDINLYLIIPILCVAGTPLADAWLSISLHIRMSCLLYTSDAADE